MKRSHIFEAKDGRTFPTAAECKQHEEQASLKILVGLTADGIASALNRQNTSLADALERVGTIIATRRRERGELKRAKKVAAAPTLEA